MYPSPAGGTGLDVCMDPKLKEGGEDAWIERLKQPEVRAQVVADMFRKAKTFENLCYAAGPDGMLLAGFKCPKAVIFTELPKTSTGKIQKHVLRDQARAL